MDNAIEEIKKRVDIVDYIGSVVTLKKTGRNFKGLCPFHQEKTPSFIVSPDRQIWHCFGACGTGGDVISFLMKLENITFVEATREFTNKLGIKLKKFDFEDHVWKKKERLISLNLYAKDFFSYILEKSKFGKNALDYLVSRQINTRTIKTFELGYAPHSWDSLIKFLKRKKYEEEELFEGGLIVRGQRGGFYDRFRGRLIFPIKDVRGNLIGFSGRLLDKQEKAAKYINTPETPIYHKRETLYGVHLAKEAIKDQKNAILVEGEFDVISPYQAGIENIVAIKGSAVTYEQLMFLKRYTNRISLALDADSAGEEAMRRGIEEAERLEFETKIIIFDFGKDPDEAVRQDQDKFKKAVKASIPLYDYLIDYFVKKNPDNDAFSKKNIAEGIVPFITNIKNPIVKSHYVKKVAELLGVSEGSVELLRRKRQQKISQRQSFKQIANKQDEEKREFIIQKYLLSSILQNDKPEGLIESAAAILESDDFTTPAYQKIYKLILVSKNNFEINSFIEKVPTELKMTIDEIYLFASHELGLEKENITRLAYEIKRYSLKKKMKNILDLDEQPKKEKEDELGQLNKKLKELEKNLIKV